MKLVIVLLLPFVVYAVNAKEGPCRSTAKAHGCFTHEVLIKRLDFDLYQSFTIVGVVINHGQNILAPHAARLALMRGIPLHCQYKDMYGNFQFEPIVGAKQVQSDALTILYIGQPLPLSLYLTSALYPHSYLQFIKTHDVRSEEIPLSQSDELDLSYNNLQEYSSTVPYGYRPQISLRYHYSWTMFKGSSLGAYLPEFVVCGLFNSLAKGRSIFDAVDADLLS